MKAPEDTRILGWLLMLTLTALLATGCETSRAVKQSADQVKATAKDVTAAVKPLPPLIEEATITVRDLHASQQALATDLDDLTAELKLTLVEARQTLGEFRALAATYRGKTVDGGPAVWLTTLKAWGWWVVAGLALWIIPSPLPRQRVAQLVQYVLSLLIQKRNGKDTSA
jgi:hypothetical protein